MHYVKRYYGRERTASLCALENANKVERVSRVEVIYETMGELNAVRSVSLIEIFPRRASKRNGDGHTSTYIHV